MADLHPGTVIHWQNYARTHGKFLVVIGTNNNREICAFTITTKDHWCALASHRPAMVEIPQGATNFLPRRSFIACFYPLERILTQEYDQGECDGEVEIVGRLRLEYLAKMRKAVDNDLLEYSDIAEAIRLLDEVLPELK